MRTAILGMTAVLAMAAVGADGAVLSLRAGGSSDPETLTLAVEETATIEIVLELFEGEDFGFAGVFLDVYNESGGEVFEAVDFLPGVTLPGARYDRSQFGPFPFDFGEGISLEEYRLSMGNVAIPGPAEIVLDRIIIHATAVGTAQVSFEQGARRPVLYDPESTPYNYIVNPGESPEGMPNYIYLGIGDGREGGAGPLTVTVTPEQGDDEGGPGDPGGGDEQPDDDGDGDDDEEPDDEPADDDSDDAEDSSDPDGEDDGDDQDGADGEADDGDDDVDQPDDQGADEPADDAGPDGDEPADGDGEPGREIPGGEDGSSPDGVSDTGSEGDDDVPPGQPLGRRCGIGMIGPMFFGMSTLGFMRWQRRPRCRNRRSL